MESGKSAGVSFEHASATSQQVAATPHHPWQVLSGTTLKWIAIFSMLCDHTASTLVQSQYQLVRLSGTADQIAFWHTVSNSLQIIGRLAFPIFCFLLVEGFIHTHSRKKYAWRLFVFALLSEIPFDFALQGTPLSFTSTGIKMSIEFGHQNVMFTLLIGLLALWAGDALGKALSKSQGLRPGVTLVTTVITITAGAIISNYCECDYHAFGIVLIGALYLGRRWQLLRFGLSGVTVYIYCIYRKFFLEMWGLISIGLLSLYNGKRGRGGTFMKYFFYAFYPCHLLLLGWLNMVLF